MIERKTQIWSIIVPILIAIIISSVFIYNTALNVEQPFPEIIIKNINEHPDTLKPIIYFGVISRYSPNIIYKGYQPIMDYLTDNTPYKFELKLSSSYQETVRQLVDNEVSAAFFGTLIYLKARKSFNIEPILKPLNADGKPFFQSALITKEDSDIKTISDLKDKKLALPSEQSFSGSGLLLYELKNSGLGLSELDSIHHFLHHHTVVHQVLMGNFDAGVVKDRVAKEFTDNGIRIFAYSTPRSSSPIVIKKEYDEEIVNSIKAALLKVDIQKPYYKDLVKNWDNEFANGFVATSEKDFDPLDSILQANGNN
ncbi:MAG: PhnD/SsuA/transferrin family substrate-binding protein [Bacteroidota bacterium]